MQDRIGDGFTLLRLGKSAPDAEPLSRAFAAHTARRFAVLDVAEERVRDLYGYNLLLLRPDLHVAWRGNAPPADPTTLAALVTGHEA